MVILMSKSASLVEDFQRYFDVELASTPLQQEQVFRVRYRIYCEEFHYEPVEAFPNKLETDEFDERSRHSLITHKATGMGAGCARLVFADEHSQMPMEKYCANAIDDKSIRPYDGRRDTICEFSRLGVDGAFRRRAGESASRFGKVAAIDCSKREERTFSLIAVATILSGFAMSELLGRPYCFAMMEPFLPRLLRRSGLIVHRIGEDIEYHGQRAPYFFETGEIMKGMPDELRAFYAVIYANFAACGSYTPQNAGVAPRTSAPQSSTSSWLPSLYGHSFAT